jgi:surface antigen
VRELNTLLQQLRLFLLLPLMLVLGMAAPGVAAADTTLCSGASYSACTGTGYTDHGYGANNANSYWRMDPGHNCTNYVAYVEQMVNGASAPSYLLGNAYQWGPNASAHGNPPDSTPKPGAVAWWDQNAGRGPLGHVAYVESVNTDGSITVSQDVANTGPFSWETLSAGSSRWPTGFIHFKDLTSGGSGWGGIGSAVYHGGATLAPGDTLSSNQYLLSANVQHALVMQTDGKLVMYHGQAVWWTDTNQSSSRLVMQTDGNLVMYTTNNTPVWSSGTGGHVGAYAVLQDDGNFVVYSSSNTPLWWTGSGVQSNLTYFGSDRLNAGQQLIQNQYLRSADGRHALLLQTDGNVVLYGPGYHILWSTGNANGGDKFVMQTDGNLVKYAINNPAWFNGASGANTYALLQNDGNFVEYNNSNAPLWWTGTSGLL